MLNLIFKKIFKNNTTIFDKMFFKYWGILYKNLKISLGILFIV
jgi:hypothetical protein